MHEVLLCFGGRGPLPAEIEHGSSGHVVSARPLDLLMWPGVVFVLGYAGGTFGFAFY
jgi:hypothetical protein